MFNRESKLKYILFEEETTDVSVLLESVCVTSSGLTT